jgi:hypothetical protein
MGHTLTTMAMMQMHATIFMNDTKTVGSISGIGSP